MELELDPAQPPQIEAAVSAALDVRDAGADPWWRAGLDQALAADPPRT